MKTLTTSAIAQSAMVAAAVVLMGGPGLAAPDTDSNMQVARLYELQAAFHAALSVVIRSTATLRP